jgi:phosphate uptake regulator
VRIKTDREITKEEKSEIKKIIKDLIGFEIVEESSREIIVKDLLDPTKVNFRKTLRRMYLMVSNMHLDLIDAISNSNMSLAMEIIQRDKEVNHLYFLSIRLLKTLATSINEDFPPATCIDLRLLIKLIEQIGDICCEIAKNISFHKSILEPAKLAYEIHKKAFKAFIKQDMKLALSVPKMQKDLVAKIKKISDPEVHECLDDFQHIGAIGKDIADLII